MDNLLDKIAYCVEFGKINKVSPYPPDMKGQDGIYELTETALKQGVPPNDILKLSLVPGMERVGKKFSENKIFVPQMLMSAKAMNTALTFFKPYFNSGEVKRKDTFVIGTVVGDLHDIGKNLVAMMIEGNGWEVIDLGTDVSSEKFLEALKKYPGCFVGISAMLTTTMVNMDSIVKDIKFAFPTSKIIIGGAPVTMEFGEKIGADFYSPSPYGAVEYLNKFVE